MCLNIIILEGCRRFGHPNPLLSCTKLCDARAAELEFWALVCPRLTNNDHQGCSNSVADLFISPTSSCSCSNGLRGVDMAPLGEQVTELKFFIHHARRGLLARDGGLTAWPFQTNAWSQEDTDYLGNNLLDFRMRCARGTVIDSDFGEVDPSLEGVYMNQPPQEDPATGHTNPAAQQEHTVNHVFGGSLPPAADQTFAASHPPVNDDTLQGKQPAQDEGDLDDLVVEEEQPIGEDKPDNGNEAGPSSARPNLKRRRSWSEEETQLLLDLHAEKDAKGKRVWTYTRMKDEIPELRGRTRNALESRVYWCTKNKTEPAPPADQ